MSEQDVFNRRIVPQNSLEVDMLITNPAWGTSDINPHLQARLKKLMQDKGLTNSTEPKEEDLWSLLSIFTRDLRLANLSRGESLYSEYYLNLAHDYLQQNLLEPFTICMSRVASKTELSQSKQGFLRKLMRTFTGESISINEDRKKSFLNKSGGKER